MQDIEVKKHGKRRKIKEMRFADFQKFLKSKGYFYDRTRGSSHHVFKNPETNLKVCMVCKHGHTVHPRSIIIALDEMKILASEFCEWLENGL